MRPDRSNRRAQPESYAVWEIHPVISSSLDGGFLLFPFVQGVLDGWTSPVRKVSRACSFVGFDPMLRFRGVDLQERVQRLRRQEPARHGLIEHARDFFDEVGAALSPGGAHGADGDPWIGIADQQRDRFQGLRVAHSASEHYGIGAHLRANAGIASQRGFADDGDGLISKALDVLRGVVLDLNGAQQLEHAAFDFGRHGNFSVGCVWHAATVNTVERCTSLGFTGFHVGCADSRLGNLDRFESLATFRKRIH